TRPPSAATRYAASRPASAWAASTTPRSPSRPCRPTRRPSRSNCCAACAAGWTSSRRRSAALPGADGQLRIGRTTARRTPFAIWRAPPQPLAEAPAPTHQLVGDLQLAGPLGGGAQLRRAGAGAGQLVRMVAAEQTAVGTLDHRRLAVGL